MTETEADELYQRAWQAHREDRHDEAISLLEQAISKTTSPAAMSAYLATKGGLFCRHNDCREAVAACDEALALEPNNFYALTQMGLAQLKLNAHAAAAEYLERAAKLRSDHNVLTMLAKSLLPSNPARAREYAKQALEIEPSWSEARAVLDAAEEADRGQE